MSIQEHLNKIRNAVYGKEVRESIAKGIETAYDDASENGNANMEVKMARGTHPNLRSRLEEVDNKQQQTTAQLAQTEDKKMDKNTVDIGVSQINKNKGLLDETYFSEEVKQQWTGDTPINAVPANNSITNEKLTNRSITAENTTFAKKGKNLFSGYYVSAAVTGGVPNGTFQLRDGALSSVTKVDETGEYRVSFSDASENDRFRIAVSAGYPDDGESVRLTSVADSATERSVILQEGEDHIIVYLADAGNGNEPQEYQIEKGGTRTTYESPFKVRFDHLDDSISHRAIIEKYGYLNSRPAYFNVSLRDNKIITDSRARVQSGSERYNLTSGEWSMQGVDSNSVTVLFDPANSTLVFTETNLLNNREYEKMIILGNINRATNSADFFGFWSFNGEEVKTYTGGSLTPIPSGKVLYISDKVGGLYEAEPTDVNPYNISIEHLYGVYDDLVNEFPNYVSRTHLGDDEGGFPLYMYEFKPTQLYDNSGQTLPKIIATCGHGHESWATYGMQLFFDELTRMWRDKDVLRMMRWNVHFIVIPNVNPWGFVNRSRLNFNGVDLNRNYPSNWSPDYTDIDFDYPGEEPLTEFGTQTMDALLRHHDDALFVLDNHNFGGDPEENGRLLYVRTNLDASKAIGEQHSRQMGTLLKKDGRVEEDKVVGHVVTELANYGNLSAHINTLGMEGFLLENTNKLNGSNTSSDLMQFNVESVGNTFLAVLRYFS